MFLHWPCSAPQVPRSLTPIEELTQVASVAQSRAQSSSQCTRKLLPRGGNWGKRMEAANSVSLSHSGMPGRRDSRNPAARPATQAIICPKQKRSVVGLCHTQNPPGPRSSPEKLVSTPGGLCTTGLQDRDVSTIAAIISSISTASDFLDSDRWEPKVTSWHSWSCEHLTFLDCPLHASTPVSQCVLK